MGEADKWGQFTGNRVVQPGIQVTNATPCNQSAEALQQAVADRQPFVRFSCSGVGQVSEGPESVVCEQPPAGLSSSTGRQPRQRDRRFQRHNRATPLRCKRTAQGAHHGRSRTGWLRLGRGTAARGGTRSRMNLGVISAGRGRGWQSLPRTLVNSDVVPTHGASAKDNSVTAHSHAATAQPTREYQGDHRRYFLTPATTCAATPLTHPSISGVRGRWACSAKGSAAAGAARLRGAWSRGRGATQ
jgi:hypothetical protein